MGKRKLRAVLDTNMIISAPLFVNRRIGKDVCKDPCDVKFLECAISGKEDSIVSGDSDLLSLGKVEGIRISPAELKKLIP